MTLLGVSYTEDETGDRIPVFVFVLVLEEQGIEIVYAESDEMPGGDEAMQWVN